MMQRGYFRDTCLYDEFFLGASCFGVGMGFGIYWEHSAIVFNTAILCLVAWLGLKFYRYIEHKDGKYGFDEKSLR